MAASGGKIKGTVVSTVMGMSLLLFLLGLLSLVGIWWTNFEKASKENISLDIFFRENAREVDVLKMEKELFTEPGVKFAKYVSPDSAKALLMSNLGEESFDILDGANPLKPSINVKFETAFINLDSVQNFKHRILKDNEVIIESIDFNEKQFLETTGVFRKHTLIMYVIAGILLFICITLIFFKIRLAVFSKRFTIKTMQLVGAKSSFIRRPFLINAIGQGLMAGLIAILLLLGFGYFIKSASPAWISELTVSEKVFNEQMLIFGGIFVGIVFLGIFISFFATYFALNRYIWMKTDKLY